MAAIFGASSLTLAPRGPALPPDWLLHGTVYAVLAVLVCRGLAGGLRRPLSGRGAALAIVIATSYGVSDEYHQSFVPGRLAEAADVGKDLGGAAFGALAFTRARRGREGAQAAR